MIVSLRHGRKGSIVRLQPGSFGHRVSLFVKQLLAKLSRPQVTCQLQRSYNMYKTFKELISFSHLESSDIFIDSMLIFHFRPSLFFSSSSSIKHLCATLRLSESSASPLDVLPKLHLVKDDGVVQPPTWISKKFQNGGEVVVLFIMLHSTQAGFSMFFCQLASHQW